MAWVLRMGKTGQDHEAAMPCAVAIAARIPEKDPGSFSFLPKECEAFNFKVGVWLS